MSDFCLLLLLACLGAPREVKYTDVGDDGGLQRPCMHSHVRGEIAGATPVFVVSCVAYVQANQLLRLLTVVPFFKLTVVPFFQVDSCAERPAESHVPPPPHPAVPLLRTHTTNDNKSSSSQVVYFRNPSGGT